VLADESAEWRPTSFGYANWGCEILLRFPSVKLADFDLSELEGNSNPFAVLILAHRRTQETQSAPQERLQWKLRVVRALYQRGLSRQDVLELFRFVDWLMVLPESAAREFDDELARFEEEQKMPYITSIERRAREEGREEGALQRLRADVLDVLETRIRRPVPAEVADRVRSVSDSAVLGALLRRAAAVENVEEFHLELERQPGTTR